MHKWDIIQTFIKKRGGLIKVLSLAYPNHEWKQENFSNRPKKASQWQLYKLIKEILPVHVEVFEDYAFKPSSTPIVFDIYVPSYKLAFEYLGRQHYQNHIMFGDFMIHKERDEQRRKSCEALEITLIEVPYWWRYDKESISTILHTQRPDVVVDQGTPKFIPFTYSEDVNKINGLSNMATYSRV